VFSPAELGLDFPHDASNCDFTMFGLAPTPFGSAGAAGCVVVKLELTCGV
jgi:hypothetical protein